MSSIIQSPPSNVREQVEALLHRVERPARYLGGEWNQVVKDHATTRFKIALCFPDVYEIGMSHLGYRLLYGILNRRDDMLAERAFTPWPDMQRELKQSGLPLTTLETGTPLDRFDVVGFSLQFELCFTNVLSALDLSGIPLRTSARTDEHPLVVAGGPVVFNPEPVADFIDAFVIGDGEETSVELAESFVEMRDAGMSRPEILAELARMPGVYVPSVYPVRTDGKTGFRVVGRPDDDSLPFPVQRRIVMDLERFPYPTDIVVPFTEIVHDRVSIEIMRGCQVGCRFCQAGYIYRPVRERSHAAVMETARKSLEATGYDEVGLTSLNSGEYPGINRLISEMMDEMVEDNTAVSFSSLRANSLTDHLAKQIRRVRKTGFTIAPEAGTDRLRRVVNKNISEADVLQACEMAFGNGWSHIKLYFMIGQPTETREDIEGILDIGKKCLAIGRKHQGRRARISLSASSFIPKSFTPFQWCRMEEIGLIREKQSWLKKRCEDAGIRFKWHHPEVSRLEGVFSIGDRSLCDVVEAAWRKGCSFDGWSEHLDMEAWSEAFAECGVDPDAFLTRDFGPEDPLPWDHLDIGVTKKFLARDLDKALEAVEEETCAGDNCYGCAPFASACTGFLHGRRTGDVFFGGLGAAGQVNDAVPGGGVKLPAFRHHDGSPAVASTRDPVSSTASGGESASSGDVAGSPGGADIEPLVYRYRTRYTKTGVLRFLSQLDLARLLARAFRRAGVPVSYSRGFHPMPKLAFGPALPVGIASVEEFLDFDTFRYVRKNEFLDNVNTSLPEGIRFTAVVPLGRGGHSLSKAINRVIYTARIPAELQTRCVDRMNGNGEELTVSAAQDRAIDALLASGSLLFRRVRENKTKEVDLRPFIADLALEAEDRLRMELHMDNGRTAKPHEVLEILYGGDCGSVQVTRRSQLVVQGDRRLSPLLARHGRGTRNTRQL